MSHDQPLVVIIHQLGFVYDGVELHVRCLQSLPERSPKAKKGKKKP